MLMYNSNGKVVKFEDLLDPTDTWELGSIIGEGTYGAVFRGFNKNSGTFVLRYFYLPSRFMLTNQNTVFSYFMKEICTFRKYKDIFQNIMFMRISLNGVFVFMKNY